MLSVSFPGELAPEMGHFFVFCLFCVLFILFTEPGLSSFNPKGGFLIDCGGKSQLLLDDLRVFEPDISSPGVEVPSASYIVSSDAEESISTDSALYNSARVFTKQSAYTITTKQTGRHWLRLHLFPVQTLQHNLKSAVFSVVANGVTLLHGFSFVKLGKHSPLVKEYIVQVDGLSSENLVLSFSPWNHSIAFINGIEVLPVPASSLPSAVVPVPLGPEVEIPCHVALETAYRVNMGGPLLTSKNDSMWRTWEPDQPYIINAASASNVEVSPRLIKYREGVSVDIAPNWVYATAQEMADANVSNQRFNISWKFRVEEGFTYLIRMHFCDIVSLALNRLIFNAYINNQSAISSLDLSSETMELSAAYYVDFVTNVSKGSNQILVQVGPSSLRSLPENAILNGLEIMKMSSPGGSFDANLEVNHRSSSSDNKRKLFLLAISSSAAALAVLAIILAASFLYFRHLKKPKQCPSPWLPIPTQMGNSQSKISSFSFPSTAHSHCFSQVLSFAEICQATKNFDESLLIGVGGFGKVYKGVLDKGITVAVKRANPRSMQGIREFRTEILMLSRLRHRHLVSLIGYCEEQNEMILVYEFMSGGPLRKHLYGSNLPPLTWKQRLQICIGAAKGLHYLHTGASETIIHRDVKTTNILLDEKLTAKVADFGLSKLGPSLDQTHVSTAVKGSFGYLDPEYFRRQQLSEKSDVYSFGVVLFEVLCARPAINPSLPREQVNVAEWAMQWQSKGSLGKVLDPRISRCVSLGSLKKFGETAEKCLAEYGSDRPKMGDVLWNLEYALQLQDAFLQNSTVSSDDSACYIPEVPEWIPPSKSVDSDGDEITNELNLDRTMTTTGVFSQIMDPKGR